ncbi:MAG: hypothetical protein JW772_04865 [Candidatus Diapherotrites archaeon]|nr:hypothetical protein [Candidatus Diapherotrites archaeon]
MKRFNSRGNVVAVVLAFALILIFLVLLGVQQNHESVFEKETARQITQETVSTMERAFENTIREFAKNSFDQPQAHWYMDRPIPTRVDRAERIITGLMQSELELLFGELERNRGYAIEGPLVTQFDVNKVDYIEWLSRNPAPRYSYELNSDANEFRVGVDLNIVASGIVGDKNKILNIPFTRFVKRIRLWYDYDRIITWMETMEDPPNGIAERTGALIGHCGERQCQENADLRTSDLSPSLPGWSASEQAAKDIATDSLSSLNAFLSPDDIECYINWLTWEYTEKPPVVRGHNTARNDYSCTCPGLDTYYENLSWFCENPLNPEPGCLKGDIEGRSELLQGWDPFDSFGKSSEGYRGGGFSPTTPEAPQNPLNMGITLHETIGSTAMFSAKYSIVCEDNRSNIARIDEFGPLEIILKFNFSAKRDCDPHPFCNGAILPLAECTGSFGGRVCYNWVQGDGTRCEDSAGVPQEPCAGSLVASAHAGQRQACCINEPVP